MAITYGFFNSVSGDRVYNADDMSMYFKGLISNGVYENIGGALQVLASTTPDMNINVQSGRAIIDNRWIENSAVLVLPITAAHVTLNRWSAVVIQLDYTTRTITITTKDGTAASNPIKPAMTNTASIKEYCLAYVYVAAGATKITGSNITDTRADTNLCGWITGLINQVDTTTLFEQWQAAYNENVDEMESWESAQQSAFESWLETLTDQLTVGAYVEEYTKNVTVTSGSGNTISLDMAGYTYNSTDVVFVSMNGLTAKETTDYVINSDVSPATITVNFANPVNEDVAIRILKSQLGTIV